MSNKSEMLRQSPRLSYVFRLKMLVAGLILLMALPLGAFGAAGQSIGPVSGLPLPRFVSLKSDRVNMHEGPTRNHPIHWIYQRAGLPVEITAEFETWNKIRDSEGAEGWVLHSLLSGRRTAMVVQGKSTGNLMLFASPNTKSAVVAALQPGVIGTLKTCDGTWCHIFGDDFDGYMQQSNLWGVYPNEPVP
jgi:SH3-like domain-containing protein